ncbi:GNAT family N-acetyltransferase [Actinoplanes sp. CA-142083]|uniref:GNAT family N-acetyltransferase n=1 Tax=Actinoplanes sp. CA-142083 TaxID=3239903 RepID=UPI003D8EAF28
MIRERTAGDLDACVAGLRAVHLTDGYPRNWPADPAGWLSPPRLLRAWVAELPEVGLAGHVAVQGDGEVSRLFVVPGARRQGVAEALVRQAVAWARASGQVLTLNVTDEQRSAAIAFYEATGWRYTHTTVAGWTGPAGEPVRLLHYRLEPGA